MTTKGMPEATPPTHEGRVLLMDKPIGWTSFDVVAVVRKILRERKVGHAGTLDPRATGLLIVCTGRMTRHIEQFMGMEKEYDAVMMLGARTASYDAETPVLEERSIDAVTPEQVRTVLQGFIGPQVQIPPMHSAVKINGKRLYAYARQGRTVERRPREVHIRSIDAIVVVPPLVTFTMVCSRGTYVRSVVNDAGTQLGCGAYLAGLRRTRIGSFSVDDALTVDLLRTRVHEDRVPVV